MLNFFKNYLFGEINKSTYTYEQLENLFNCLNNNTRHQWELLIRKTITRNEQLIHIFGTLFYSSIERNDGLHTDCIEKIIEIEPNVASHEEWESLRFVSIVRGELLVSHYCREKAICQLEAKRGYNSIFKRISICIEKGDLKNAKRNLSLICISPMRFTYTYKSYNSLINVLTNKKKSSSSKFSEFVRNKRIIVIGPAGSEKQINDYNKQDDIILRFTYRGKKYLPNINSDLPTNLSYYNVEASKKLLSDNPPFLKDLDFYCCRIPKIDVKDSKGRCEDIYNFAIPFGILLSGQACILDLLQFDIKSIYLTNYNLYYSKQKHEKNYEISELTPYRTYAYHDIEGNFNLVKNLKSAGLITCDDELNTVLNMSSEEYMRGLEQF